MSMLPKFKVGDRVINHCRKSRLDGEHYYGTSLAMVEYEKDTTLLVVTYVNTDCIRCKPAKQGFRDFSYHQEELKLYCSPVFVSEKEE